MSPVKSPFANLLRHLHASKTVDTIAYVRPSAQREERPRVHAAIPYA